MSVWQGFWRHLRRALGRAGKASFKDHLGAFPGGDFPRAPAIPRDVDFD